ncbi:gamma-glutamyltransferase [Pseudanabaena sp. FACHB-2040]|uniref:gamma-glutamyltransferase n=1 Tax=Pseudanabaena sp. FACHB-2040 TaxID=2692859 RepID=UPI0016862527|nr:gamma-glutamyltransferase [Pseudanabaena sp. FACHB-2040]MBD2258624.1 gamma-glutamyltransferase [Pseudanabaena sp. FACHB-2040]
MGQPTQGVIAAGHPLTAAAGADMLRQGGNAFDAAVAAVFTACVTESTLTSVAGGGFLLAHTAEGEDVLFDFFCQTPAAKNIGKPPDFYPIQANFGDAVQEFHVGLGSMAVPGNLAGLLTVHRRLGRLPLAAVVEPAVHWAKQGVEIDEFRAYCFELLAPILTATAGARAFYAPQGHLLRQGDCLAMPEFADFLTRLIKAGPEDFYQGELAQQIVYDCQQAGGYLSLTDLQNYRVIERKPLSIRYRGTTLLTNPPPSTGGTLIAFALKVLEQAPVNSLQPGSPAYLALLREAMSLTNQARRDGYDANLYQANIAEWFLGESHLAYYHDSYRGAVNKWGSTTHVSVVDGEGNAASVTTSNGEGSSYVIPGTGIMVNNMLGEEDLNPQGFHQWQPNQRISSMMAPTMVLQGNRPQLVMGSGGSNRIRTAILQVILNTVDFGMSLEEAVSAPRVHWERDTFHLEPGFDRAALEAASVGMADKKIWWQQPNMFFGGVHSVAIQSDGSLMGAGDARRAGAIAQP